eukprot:scaffold1841_cov61-Phaeocystis_antarctica.AAC.8
MTIRVAQAPMTSRQGDELLNAVARGGTGVAAGSGVPSRGVSKSGLKPATAVLESGAAGDIAHGVQNWVFIRRTNTVHYKSATFNVTGPWASFGAYQSAGGE